MSALQNDLQKQDTQTLKEQLLKKDLLDDDQQNKSNTYKILDYDQIIIRVGGFGRFQWLANLMTMISFITEGCLIYSFAFLTLMPDYICLSSTGSPQSCTNQDTCQIDQQNSLFQSGQSYYVNWNNQTSLHNLVEKFDMRCSQSWEIGFLGSAYFIGAVLGNLFLSRLGDLYGRIRMIRIGISSSLVLYTMFLFLPTPIIIKYLILLAFGTLTCFRVSIAYLYGQEITPQKYSNTVGSIYNVFDSMTMIIASVYYKYISKYYEGIHLFFFGMILLSVMISFFMPESPKYLISNNKFHDARYILNKIAKMNKV